MKLHTKVSFFDYLVTGARSCVFKNLNAFRRPPSSIPDHRMGAERLTSCLLTVSYFFNKTTNTILASGHSLLVFPRQAWSREGKALPGFCTKSIHKWRPLYTSSRVSRLLSAWAADQGLQTRGAETSLGLKVSSRLVRFFF